MFNKLVPLNSKAHAGLCYYVPKSYDYARREMLTPVLAGEAQVVAREYSFVFPRDTGGVPQAILGIEEGVNFYAGTQPAWLARYIPAHIRRYPFIMAPKPQVGASHEENRQFVVLIDEAAPQLGYDQGEPLFDQDGQPGSVLKKVQTMLIHLQRDFERTIQLVQDIEEAGLLVERHIRVKRKKVEISGLTGFRSVDIKRLNSLPPDTLKSLTQSGALMLVYAHIISLTNLEDGLIAKKAQGQVEPADVPDFESLFGGKDDAFRFDA